MTIDSPTPQPEKKPNGKRRAKVLHEIEEFSVVFKEILAVQEERNRQLIAEVEKMAERIHKLMS